jgi:hypothetical protein
MSEKLTVVEALSHVMSDVQAIGKDGRNTSQNYSFRGVDAVVNAVGPLMRKHGVIVVPHSVSAHYRDALTSTGKPARECTLEVAYRFYGPAGDYIEAMVPGESLDFGDKGAPKAMSVAYRILLLQALCIPTDDVEPDSQTYERATPERVSDLTWLDDFDTKVTAAMTETDLAALEAAAQRKFHDRELEADDAKRVKAAIDARRSELVPAS